MEKILVFIYNRYDYAGKRIRISLCIIYYNIVNNIFGRPSFRLVSVYYLHARDQFNTPSATKRLNPICLCVFQTIDRVYKIFSIRHARIRTRILQPLGIIYYNLLCLPQYKEIK